METPINSGMGDIPNTPISGMPTPKSKIPTILITVIMAAIIVGGIAYAITSNRNDKVATTTTTPTSNSSVTTSVSPSVSPTPEVTTTPTTVAQSKVYSNTYLSVTIPSGWSYSATQSGAVNITKNNYILYINPRAQQASVIQGGRYGEIAAGAPSSDAVNNLDAGNAPCTPAEAHVIAGGYSRYDYYVSKQSADSYLVRCTAPSDGSNVWYFSYASKDGHFLNHTAEQEGTAVGYAITMAYNSKDVNALPKKGGTELNTMLNEMTNIVATFKMKTTPSPTPTSTALKTYTNTQLGYTLKYPSDWDMGSCGLDNCQAFRAPPQYGDSSEDNFMVLYYGNYGDDRDMVDAIAIETSAGYQCQESIQKINNVNWTKRTCLAKNQPKQRDTTWISYIAQSQKGVYKMNLGPQNHPMYAKSLAIAQSIKLTSFSTPTPPIEISIISPAGGEQWKAGETYTISWTISGAKYYSIGWYKGSLNGGGGSLAYRHLVNSNAGISSFQWTIPDSFSAGDDYTIVISAKRNDELGPPADKWVYSKTFSIIK